MLASMYEQHHWQSAANFLSFWDEPLEDRGRLNSTPQHLDEARIQLLLFLSVADLSGTPRCMFSEGIYRRCWHLIDNSKLYQAFKDLYFIASDPLLPLKEEDPDLVDALTTFITGASCERHGEDVPEAAADHAERLMGCLQSWRKQYVFNDRSSVELSPSEQDLVPQPSRLSRFFIAGKMGSLNRQARRRGRSVSPACTTPDSDDENSTKPFPRHTLRPRVSVPDMKRQKRASQHAPRASVDGSRERLHVDWRAATDRRSTLLEVGAGIMTRLAAKM